MIGRVGTAFGEEGVNIISAAAGAEPGGDRGGDGADDRRPGAGRETIDKTLELERFSVGPRSTCGGRRQA